MARTELELKPVDFITVGTIGPKGQRTFHLQAGKGGRIVSFTIEKEQAWALSEAIGELLEDLEERYGSATSVTLEEWDMELREPINPLFRISQMGLAHHSELDLVVLEAQELVPSEEERTEEPGVVRMWATREQMLALSMHAAEVVSAGRPDPKQNGRIIYYWT